MRIKKKIEETKAILDCLGVNEEEKIFEEYEMAIESYEKFFGIVELMSMMDGEDPKLEVDLQFHFNQLRKDYLYARNDVRGVLRRG